LREKWMIDADYIPAELWLKGVQHFRD
jgi:hypothetical protein